MNLDKNLFKADYISEAREILDSLDDMASFCHHVEEITCRVIFRSDVISSVPVVSAPLFYGFHTSSTLVLHLYEVVVPIGINGYPYCYAASDGCV